MDTRQPTGSMGDGLAYLFLSLGSGALAAWCGYMTYHLTAETNPQDAPYSVNHKYSMLSSLGAAGFGLASLVFLNMGGKEIYAVVKNSEKCASISNKCCAFFGRRGQDQESLNDEDQLNVPLVSNPY